MRPAAKTVQKLSNTFVVDRSIEGMAKVGSFFLVILRATFYMNFQFPTNMCNSLYLYLQVKYKLCCLIDSNEACLKFEKNLRLIEKHLTSTLMVEIYLKPFYITTFNYSSIKICLSLYLIVCC